MRGRGLSAPIFLTEDSPEDIFAKVKSGQRNYFEFSLFSSDARIAIVPNMTRMRHIFMASNAQSGARFAVNLRGLLLLTLR